MGDSFRKYLSQERGTGKDDDAAVFRRSRAISEERDESIPYEEGSSLRDTEVVAEDEKTIEVNKKGKELLFHNMISAGMAGAAKQVYLFFRRLIQR